MASAFPSRGVDHPAARSAVRSLGCRCPSDLGPGGEVSGGIAVPVYNEPAAVAAEHPLAQLHWRRDPPTLRAGPGGWHPAVTDDQFSAKPIRFVVELPGQLGPGGVTDGAGESSVAEQVGDGEVFQAKPIVGLDELAGDLVQEVPAHVGDACVFPGQSPDGLGVVGGSGLGARCRARSGPQAEHAALERLGCCEAANLGSGGGGYYGEGGKATVDPDKAAMVVGGTGWVTTLRVEVRRLDVEADVPTSAMPTTGGEEDSGPRRHHELPVSRILRDGTEQPPQPTGVVMYTNRADPRQGHRARMAFSNPDRRGAAAARLIAEPEALAAATLALVPREADPASLGLGDPALFVGRQCATKVDGCFHEYLCRYLVSPCQAGNLLGDGSVRRNDEAASSCLASLPGIKCVDQIEPGPWHGYRWVAGFSLERLGDELQALVVCKAGGARITSQ